MSNTEEFHIFPDGLRVLAIVGMAGSGKSTAVKYTDSLGIPSVHFGNTVYAEMARIGIEITPSSQKEFRERMRKEHGEDYFAQLVLEKALELVKAGHRRIVLDGLYSMAEREFFATHFAYRLRILAILTDKEIRYERLLSRPKDRPGTAFTREDIVKRDHTEVKNLDKGGPIALADYFLDNNGNKAELVTRLKRLLARIEF